MVYGVPSGFSAGNCKPYERPNTRRLIVNCLRHTSPYDISVTFSKAAISPYTLTRTLVPALGKTTDSWTSRQQNQLSAISECTTDVRHIAGKDNQVADALSRITIDAVELAQGVDFHAMALAKDSDDDIIHLRNDTATALRLENVRLNSTTSLLCDTSTGVQRPVVPAPFRRRVFDAVHGLSHPGILTTRRLLTSKFVWPRIASDAASWARACVPCQQSKVNRHIHAPIRNFRPRHVVSVTCMLMLSGP